MFITKRNLNNLLRYLGLEIPPTGYITYSGSEPLISRIAKLERLRELNHDEILTLLIN